MGGGVSQQPLHEPQHPGRQVVGGQGWRVRWQGAEQVALHQRARRLLQQGPEVRVEGQAVARLGQQAHAAEAPAQGRRHRLLGRAKHCGQAAAGGGPAAAQVLFEQMFQGGASPNQVGEQEQVALHPGEAEQFGQGVLVAPEQGADPAPQGLPLALQRLEQLAAQPVLVQARQAHQLAVPPMVGRDPRDPVVVGVDLEPDILFILHLGAMGGPLAPLASLAPLARHQRAEHRLHLVPEQPGHEAQHLPLQRLLAPEQPGHPEDQVARHVAVVVKVQVQLPDAGLALTWLVVAHNFLRRRGRCCAEIPRCTSSCEPGGRGRRST